MAWTTPRTWVTSEVVTKALLDTHLRDNLQYLKDVLDGAASQTVVLLGSFAARSGVNARASATNFPVFSLTPSGTMATGEYYDIFWAAAATDGQDRGKLRYKLVNAGGVYQQWEWYGHTGAGEVLVMTLPNAGRATLTNGAMFGDGTVSLPGVGFASDPDTGLYRSAANTLDVALGGAQQAQISSVGVLAAGTTVSTGVFSFINDPDTGIARSAANTLAVNVGGNSRFIVAESGSLYGESAPYLQSSGARIAIAVDSVVPFIVDRGVNDGTLISLRQGGTEEGSISVSSTTVAYNTFMGAHMTQLKPGQDEPPPGGVVVTTGEIVQSDNVHYIEDVIEVVPEPERAPDATEELKAEAVARETIVRQVRHEKRENSAWREVRGETKDYLPHVAGTTTEGDPAVYGVWIGMLREDAAGSSFGKNGRPVYNVAGLGAYEVRVTDLGGDIVAGDLLCASKRMYEGQRQADDVLRAGTLGKALGNVRWDDVPVDRALGYRWALVSVALYCG